LAVHLRNASDSNLHTSKNYSNVLDGTIDSIPQVTSNRCSMVKFLRQEEARQRTNQPNSITIDPYRSADNIHEQ